jgi:hypothetical protein
MGTCFVIQPFDGGKFDKRYEDVYCPAIRATGLEPYRVDADPGASIPIDEIENGIRNAELCFADITLDNPNVWFELGYALASFKDICLICSEERIGKFPFDVQHRQIIKYRVDSPSDYKRLEQNITNRISAIQQKSSNLATLSTSSPIKDEPGLTQHEMMVLATIMESIDGPGNSVAHGYIKRELEKLGYNNLALNIGLTRLVKRGMINYREEYDQEYDNSYNLYSIQEAGLEWLLENYSHLNLKTSNPTTRKSKPAPNLDDEIPF